MITVMGATGPTGGATARRLLDAGEHVRVLGRSADRLAPLRDAGAEPFPLDARDAAALTEALRGAEAAYVLLPFDPEVPDVSTHMAQAAEAIVTAVRAAGVPHVVAISAVGADLPSGTGLLTNMYGLEQRLQALTDVADVLALRPGAYFENAYGWLPVIAEQGVMADSVAPDAPLPMVATDDVGAAAASALRSRDWTGFVVRELLGPGDLTYVDVARMIGAAIGRPHLPYVQISEEDLRAALEAAGWSPDATRRQVEMNRVFSDGSVAARSTRTPASTTPTPFEDFAATDLAPAFALLRSDVR